MIGTADTLAARRLMITEAAPRRIIPTGQVGRRVDCRVLDEHIAALDRGGARAAGLPTRREHLVMWATVAALADHPHFNAFYLPAGQTHQVDSVSLRLPVGGPGSLATGVLAEPAGLDLPTLAEAVEAWAVESSGEARRAIRRRIRKRRQRPLFHRLLGDPLLGALSSLRDRFGLPPAWIGLAVARAGSFTALGLERLGAEACGGPLLGARVAELRCAAAVALMRPDPAGPRPGHDLPIQLAFDLRLFEPAEAAALLADICQRLEQLAPPAAKSQR